MGLMGKWHGKGRGVREMEQSLVDSGGSFGVFRYSFCYADGKCSHQRILHSPFRIRLAGQFLGAARCGCN